MIPTYHSHTKYVECAICKRYTSVNHTEEIHDFHVCCWCGN